MVLTSKPRGNLELLERGNLETWVKIMNRPLLLAVVLQRFGNAGLFTQRCFAFTYLWMGEIIKVIQAPSTGASLLTNTWLSNATCSA